MASDIIGLRQLKSTESFPVEQTPILNTNSSSPWIPIFQWIILIPAFLIVWFFVASSMGWFWRVLHFTVMDFIATIPAAGIASNICISAIAPNKTIGSLLVIITSLVLTILWCFFCINTIEPFWIIPKIGMQILVVFASLASLIGCFIGCLVSSDKQN